MNSRLRQCLGTLTALDVLDARSKTSRCELRLSEETHEALAEIALTNKISTNRLITILVKWLIQTEPTDEQCQFDGMLPS